MIRCIGNYDAVVPVDSNGWKQPLIGLYRNGVAEAIEKQIAADKWSVRDLISTIRVEHIPLTFGWYRNLNTPEDYQEYLEQHKASLRLKGWFQLTAKERKETQSRCGIEVGRREARLKE